MHFNIQKLHQNGELCTNTIAAPSVRAFIGPTSAFRGISDAAEEIAGAVTAAGGEVVSNAAEANAIVSLSGADAKALKANLHHGIVWVQVPAAGVDQLLASGLIATGLTFTGGDGSYAKPVGPRLPSLIC